MKIVLISILAAWGIAGLNIWADGRDADVRMAIVAYENCVQAEYHMTPVAFYEQTGKYPNCGN